MKKYDIEANIKNCRESKNAFLTGYRPIFDIHQNYSTSGEINLIHKDELGYSEETKALIRFLTPEIYPKSIWVGKKIVFKEGQVLTGYAIVTKILNCDLNADVAGIEGPLNL